MFGDMESYLEQYVEDIWDNLDTEDDQKEWLNSHSNVYGINSSDLADEIYDFLIDSGELRRDTVFSETIQQIIYSNRDRLANHLMDYILMECVKSKWEELFD